MVTINGIESSDLAVMSLFSFLESHGYNPERIVVELNYGIVPKKNYTDTILQDQDVLEILTFVGGG